MGFTKPTMKIYKGTKLTNIAKRDVVKIKWTIKDPTFFMCCRIIEVFMNILIKSINYSQCVGY